MLEESFSRSLPWRRRLQSAAGAAILALAYYAAVWPGIAIGAFFVASLTLPPTTGLIASLAIAVGNTLICRTN